MGALFFLPTGVGGNLGDFTSLLCRKRFSARGTASLATCATLNFLWMTFGLTEGIFYIASSNVEYQLRKLVWIAWPFVLWHDMSMP